MIQELAAMLDAVPGLAGLRRDLLGRSEAMRLLNKIRNRARISRVWAKRGVGRVTGNRRLQAEELADSVGGGARQFGEDVRNGLRKAGLGIERAFGR
jgi:uncharacterized protein YjbJ (UPF0337 family)